MCVKKIVNIEPSSLQKEKLYKGEFNSIILETHVFFYIFCNLTQKKINYIPTKINIKDTNLLRKEDRSIKKRGAEGLELKKVL